MLLGPVQRRAWLVRDRCAMRDKRRPLQQKPIEASAVPKENPLDVRLRAVEQLVWMAEGRRQGSEEERSRLTTWIAALGLLVSLGAAVAAWLALH